MTSRDSTLAEPRLALAFEQQQTDFHLAESLRLMIAAFQNLIEARGRRLVAV